MDKTVLVRIKLDDRTLQRLTRKAKDEGMSRPAWLGVHLRRLADASDRTTRIVK